MTDWKALSHAYGEASNIPALIEKLSRDSNDIAWGELWNYLCHQGTVYSASYAALIPLLKFVQTLAPSERLVPLMLMGAIVASDDIVGMDERPVDIIEQIAPALQQLAEESLRLSENDTATFICLLEAAAAFNGDLFWGKYLNHLVDGEFPGRCPVCQHDLYIVIGADGFFVTAQDWVKPRDTKSRRAPIAPAERASLSGRSNWLHDTALQYHQPDVASWIRHIFGTTECPACDMGCDVAQAIAHVYPPKH